MNRVSLRPVVFSAAGAALMIALSACGSTSPSPTPTPVQPLSVACPANVTVTVPVGATSMTVPYDAPVVTGGTPPVSVACAPASGSTFPLGTTAVNCTATDALGRMAVCPTPTSIIVKSHTIGVMNIVAFGDSITAGENGLSGQPTFVAPSTCSEPPATAGRFGAIRSLDNARPQFIDLPNSYPTQLLNLLNATFIQAFTMDNRGWPGENTQQGVTRLQCVLSVDHPDTLLLLEGINTLAQGGFSQTAMSQVVNDLRSDIQSAHAAGVSFIFVGTLLPSGNCKSGCNGTLSNNPSIQQTNSQIQAMVANNASLGATLVDLYAAYAAVDAPNYTTLIDTDGLHPTPAGNALTAKTFFNAIVAKAPVTSVRRLHR